MTAPYGRLPVVPRTVFSVIGLLILSQFCIVSIASIVSVAAQTQPTQRANPQSGAQKTVLPVVLFNSWRDPREGAFTVNVPQGWQVSGGASRRSAVDITQVVRAASSEGRVQVFMNDPDIIPRQVPDAMMMRMGGMREGQTIRAAWGGPILLERFRNGAQYAQEYVSQRLCRQPEFTSMRELQDETTQMNQQQVQPFANNVGVKAQASIGEAYFRCGSDLGYVAATTLISGPLRGPGAVIWVVFQLSGFVVKAPVDAGYAMYVLHIMNSSFHLDPQWEARSQQQATALTASVTQMQNAMAASLAQQAANQAAQEQASVVNHPAPDVMSGWERRNKELDTTMEKDTEVRRGVTTTADPIWGSRTVSNDYNYYWTRSDGSIVGTTTNGPPQDGTNSNWRLMTTH